ncbi:MAG: hypothetical protein ACRDRX_07770 [Pseudonocardiaceae bacterium]
MSEPHVIHLLPAEWELLAECHRRRVYLEMCGAELPVLELPGLLCGDGCEREITYCVECLDDAAGQNADAGLAWSPPGPPLTVDAQAPGGGASR